MGGWTTALRMGGRTVRFAAHNPKTALGFAGGSMLGWNYFVNDESLLEQATDVALGEDASKGLRDGGVAGGLKGAVFGADGADKSIGENVVDGVVGQGTYHQIGETAGNVVDAAGNIIHSAGQGVQQAYNNAGQMVQNYQQQAVLPQQDGGLFSALNPFSGISNLVGSFFGGGSALSLAALIPAAFLMFGNFGWMGKIASLFLGSLAMKNMRSQQQVMYVPQQQLPYQQVQQQQNYQPQLAQAQEEEEENANVVHRRRG